MKRQHNVTGCVVQFHTWANGLVEARDVRRPGFVGPVVAWDTAKSLGAPFGTWSVQLKGYAVGGAFHGVPWPDLVEAGDWCTIDVVKNGAWRGVLIGLVDDVSVSMQAGGAGAGEIVVTVSGRDGGAPLSDAPVYFNPHDPIHNNAGGKDMAGVLLGGFVGKPHELIPGAIRGLYGADGLYGTVLELPPSLGGGLWVDMLDMSLGSAGGTVQDNLRGIAFTPSVLTTDGAPTVWGFLDAWRNPVLNEMWVDSTVAVGDLARGAAASTSRRLYLHLRERPLVNRMDGPASPWFRLTAHTLDARLVQGVNLSRGRNRINHVMLSAEPGKLLGQDAYALYLPVANGTSIRRYNLRKLEESTTFYGDDQGEAFTSTFREWMDLITCWNVLNHREWSGTITVPELRPEIRVGQKVQLANGPLRNYPAFPTDAGVPGRYMSFYTEGVRHHYVAAQRPVLTTTLEVTHGFVEGDRADSVTTAVGEWGDGVTLAPTGSADRFDFEPARDRNDILAAVERVEVA